MNRKRLGRLMVVVAVLGVLVVFLAAASPALAQKKAQKRSPLQSITDNPKLPRVLLIGDSISIGYTLPVRDQLKEVANVHRPSENCAGTTRGLERIDAWLGDGKWDVIHFNWGLHDLKYVNAENQLTDVDKGKQQADLEQYKKNLEQLVRRLEKTKAKLIFATTTPVPEGSKGRVPGDEVRYNAAAVEIMKKHGIEVDDLCALVGTLPDECKREANVHYTAAGSQRLGQQVAKVITQALKAAEE